MWRKNGSPEFAVIGLGRFGRAVASTLIQRGFAVLGIDRDPQIVQQLSDEMDHVVALDSTDEDALHSVDIISFDTVVVAIGTNFESNLMTTVALKGLGVRRVVCKAFTERQKTILLRVGADQVVLPEHEAGARLAFRLIEPLVRDHLDLGAGFSVAEMITPRRLVGQTLAESNLRQGYGINVLAVKHGGTMTVNPAPEYTFGQNDVIVVIGSDQSITSFCEIK
jgi:trk system potassium uptake protein TrkA